MPDKLKPRVLDRPDKKESAAENRMRVWILCIKHGISAECEEEAQLHAAACIAAGLKLKW